MSQDEPSPARPDGWTAAIVAAGRGSRLRAPAKPFAPVAGVALIRRVMDAAARAGVRRFVVVVGFEAERAKALLPELVPRGCALECVENPRFDEPNGLSLLAAARRLGEPFALLMADHLFAPERLALALARFEATGRPLVTVEPRERFRGDLEDATRVAAEGGKVRAIGKGLAGYDAIDCGMFVLEPRATVRALERAGPSPSISDGARALAEEGRLDAFDPGRGWWRDVDTEADLRAAERELLASLAKPTDGWLARRVNRRVSLFLTARLWRTGATPNAVTAATLALGLAAGLAFAQGGLAWSLAGAALFQAHSIVDGVDGELARLLLKESRVGAWLDLASDNLTHVAVFAGIAAGRAAEGEPGPWLALGVAAGLGVLASFAAAAPLVVPGGAAERGGGRLRALVLALARRDFTWALFPLALLGWLGGFLWCAAIGAWVYAAAALALRARSAAGSPSSPLQSGGSASHHGPPRPPKGARARPR